MIAFVTVTAAVIARIIHDTRPSGSLALAKKRSGRFFPAVPTTVIPAVFKRESLFLFAATVF
ncbi:MAG: hypothetical protein ACR2P7_01190 [bacterium]